MHKIIHIPTVMNITYESTNIVRTFESKAQAEEQFNKFGYYTVDDKHVCLFIYPWYESCHSLSPDRHLFEIIEHV